MEYRRMEQRIRNGNELVGLDSVIFSELFSDFIARDILGDVSDCQRNRSLQSRSSIVKTIDSKNKSKRGGSKAI